MRISASALIRVSVFSATAMALVLVSSSCSLFQGPNDPPPIRFDCMDFPRLNPDLPGDVNLPNHPNVQCFGWQQFIALNWPADSMQAGVPDRARGAAEFGEPGDAQPLVWETFKEAHEVFLPDGSAPPAWGASGLRRSLPALRLAEGSDARRSGKRIETLSQKDGLMVFRMRTMISPQSQRLQRFIQAGGGWLTAQNGKLTHYGIHMNRAEFDYVSANRFYNAREQSGAHISLPAGRTASSPRGATEGSIELKSAWVEITDPAQRSRFRTVEACIVEDDRCRAAVVGLVGLHIIHKTETFPQWAWATFEHVDNAPDREDVRQASLKPSYTFHDPACRDARPQCVANRFPADGEPLDRPNQVVRSTPLSPTVRDLNRKMQELIRDANVDSVWQYYQLVDVQWPEAGETITSRRDVPLPLGGPTPTSLANSTIETYVQHTPCLDCHRQATIACSSAETNPRNASDYSFLFSMARELNTPAECM